MFDQIVIVDKTNLQAWAIDELNSLSAAPIVVYDDYPTSNQEIVTRIANADAVFVSWHTPIDEEVLGNCSQVRYVGMCCSLYDEKSANVDIQFARTKGMVVKGVRDYGDEGVAEYIVSEVIGLCKGLGDVMWKTHPVELSSVKFGIIGFGATGQMLAHRLLAFGAKVYYYNRSRKLVQEEQGVEYLPLDDLLAEVDVISLHLPRHTNILGQEEFEKYGRGKILINTSLDLVFDKDAFLQWVVKEGNFALFDADGIGDCQDEFEPYGNIISTTKVSGVTVEAKRRLSEKVLKNVRSFFEESK